MISTLVKSCIRGFGYDVHEYPTPDWYLLRAGLSEIFHTQSINCVIDVGANCGQYGDFLRKIGFKDRIVSFEPVSANFKLLVERSSRDQAWHTYNLAAGTASQTLDINVMRASQFSSLLPRSDYGAKQFTEETTITHTEQVQVVRLDSMLSEITRGIQEPRVYLKMDTQGFDLQVFDGASGLLPYIFGMQSELSLKPLYDGMPSYLTALAKFNDAGFSATSIIPVVRDEQLRVIELDCIMVRS